MSETNPHGGQAERLREIASASLQQVNDNDAQLAANRHRADYLADIRNDPYLNHERRLEQERQYMLQKIENHKRRAITVDRNLQPAVRAFQEPPLGFDLGDPVPFNGGGRRAVATPVAPAPEPILRSSVSLKYQGQGVFRGSVAPTTAPKASGAAPFASLGRDNFKPSLASAMGSAYSVPVFSNRGRGAVGAPRRVPTKPTTGGPATSRDVGHGEASQTNKEQKSAGTPTSTTTDSERTIQQQAEEQIENATSPTYERTFNTAKEAEAFLHGDGCEHIELNIDSDDVESCTPDVFHNLASDIFQSFWAPNPTTTQDSSKGEQEASQWIRHLHQHPNQTTRANAVAVTIVAAAQSLHEKGIPSHEVFTSPHQLITERGYPLDHSTKFTTRISKIARVLTNSKLAAKDVLVDDAFSARVRDLVYAPDAYLARKVTNAKGNARRAGNKKRSRSQTEQVAGGPVANHKPLSAVAVDDDDAEAALRREAEDYLRGEQSQTFEGIVDLTSP
ncbi:hypothetical protein MBLNU230_g5596t1 [Neophaeotheca triangularis]